MSADDFVGDQAPLRTPDSEAMMGGVAVASQAATGSINLESIAAFVEEQPDVEGPVVVRELPRGSGRGGYSSGMLFLEVEYLDPDRGRITRESVLRYAPGGEQRIHVEYDLGRQFDLQRALQDTAVPTPMPLWLDRSGDFLGSPGYMMELVKGDAAANVWLYGATFFTEASHDQRESMVHDLVRTMGKIHEVDVDAHGLRGHMMAAEGATGLERIINQRWRTWEWLRTDEESRLRTIRDELVSGQPDHEEVLVHGDSNYGNYLFKDGKVAAVLDWESSSVGPRELDVAIQLHINRHNLQDRGIPSTGAPSQSEWVER